MKKIMILLVAMALVLGVTGCTKPVNVPIADVLAEVKEAIKAGLLAGGSFTEEDLAEGLPGLVEGNMLEDDLMLFVSDPDLFEKELISAGCILAPMFNVMSDEVILLKAKDKGAVKELQTALEQEKKNRLQQWESYLPDQYEKVKNTIIKVEGQYLLYTTWEDPAIIEAAFTKALGK
jgi:hypothetical protein